jgi:hypothetical protein
MMTFATSAHAGARAHAAQIGTTAGAAFAESAGSAAGDQLGTDNVTPVGGDGTTGSGSTGSTGSDGSTGSTGSTGSGDPKPPATHDVQFGAFTDGSPYDGNVDSIDALQARLGRHVDIVNWYQSFGGGDWVSQVQPGVLAAVTASGRAPLLTWEPWDPAKGADQPEYSLRKIANGAFDDYLGQWADGLKATGSTIYLRPMHEMNGNWYPWSGTVNGNTPADYVAAWRHMHDVFEAHGATKVRWVWSPVPYSVPHTPANAIEKYWPGGAYVDVMALDGYNWGSEHPENGGWQSFSEIFKDAYDRLAALGSEPIWLAEVGCAPQGGDKSAWVKDMWATAKTWSRLDAIVWFDQNKEEDWRALPVASAFYDRG